MKSLILTLTLLASSLAMAQTIQYSDYEQEHQDVIIKAISKRCSVPATALRQAESTAKAIRVDNGITDIEYTTVIYSREYAITVHSFFADYDNVGTGSRYSVTGIDSAYCQ